MWKIYFNGSSEPSFGISYNTDANIIKELNRIGADCNQDSVTHSQGGIMEWHYTTGENIGNRIVCGKSTKVIKPDNKTKYFSMGRISQSSYPYQKHHQTFFGP